MKAYFQKRILKFKQPAGTSRGILYQKPAWYIYLYDEDEPTKKGIGEVSFVPGLSIDIESEIENKLSEVCQQINAEEFDFLMPIYEFPGIGFALESALLDFKSKRDKILFKSDFTDTKSGIPINGLVWMGNMETMLSRVEEKLNAGFTCIKLKIGALELNDELQIIKNLRARFNEKELQIRVDANGAFNYEQALKLLDKLESLDIHSIEQPILPNQLEEMSLLCEKSSVPIALDEELIGKHPYENKRLLVEIIQPQYLVLKPGLLGGFRETTEWVNIANEFDCKWWTTSALESNIGLNAIAQWVAVMNNQLPQGLGTGQLYVNNVNSPLKVVGEKIFYDSSKQWELDFVY